MPYNTRRKSLSLPSLGIHVPVTHAARDAARDAARAAAVAAAAAKPSSSAPLTASAATTPFSSTNAAATLRRQSTPAPDHTDTTMSPSASPKRQSSDDSSSPAQQPSKRTKRAHAGKESAAAAAAAAAASAATPPPSPKQKPVRHASIDMDVIESDSEIDMDTVNDDIVEAVIRQLQATGNRPHLIKELSAILMLQLKSVQQSANPCAIICSRLSSYMKRPCWSATKTCPLTKELETIHPRRTYYFLTTCPHMPLPDASSVHFIVPRTSIVTPPLSSAASGSEATEEERRRELSPSPEVDLTAPDFDEFDDDIPMPGTPIHPLSGRYPQFSSRNQRGASPPLEKDEKEFTQTAEGLQRQKLAGNAFLLNSAMIAATTVLPSTASHSRDHGMELDDGSRDEAILFGTESGHLVVSSASNFTLMTSPAMRPTFGLSSGPKRESEAESWAKLDTMLDWDRSPENVELDELDCLLDEF